MKLQSGSLIRLITVLSCLLIGGWGLGAQEGTAPPPPPDKTTATPPPGGTGTPPSADSGTQSSPGATQAGKLRIPGLPQNTPAGNRPSGGNRQAGAAASSGSGGSSAKNWVAGNVGLLGVGAQYERVFTPKLSVGAGIYWYSLVLFSTFGLEANVRYYPFSGRLQGLYGDVGLGFGIAINAYGDEDSWGSMGGFLLRPGIGWKFDVGKPGGFFIEPHLSIPLVFGTREKEVYRSGYGYDTESTADVGANFVARMALGYAF